MDKLFTKLGISFGVSVAVAENVNLQPLWTALITFAVSVLTVLTVEGVAWLRAWFQKKRAKEEAEEKKYEEADEIVAIAKAEDMNKKED